MNAEKQVIRLNGQEKEIAAKMPLAELLRNLELSPERVAVEINLSIVPRHRYEHTMLCPGDRVEVVTFVGGG